MHMRLIIHAGCLLFGMLTVTTVSFAQPAPNATASPSPNPLIVYSGSLFGYFRLPSRQLLEAPYGCPVRIAALAEKNDASSNAANSPAADVFLAVRNNNINALSPDYRKKIQGQYTAEDLKNLQNAVLVGTGDNFAPRLEARQFDVNQVSASEYVVRNKEPYYWDPKSQKWLLERNKKLYWWDAIAQKWVEADNRDLLGLVEAGKGTIPDDNVACFLAAARFAAVVPGKHDFYYGPERLRELARSLASMRLKDGSRPPQMLGANLVIKTTRVDASAAPPKDKKTSWPDDLVVKGLDSVYPWFSSSVAITIQPAHDNVAKDLKQWLANMKPTDPRRKNIDLDLREFLKEKAGTASDEQEAWGDLSSAVNGLGSLYVCPVDDSGQLAPADCEKRGQMKINAATVEDNAIVYSFDPPAPAASVGKDGNYSTFLPGQNRLCLDRKGNKSDPARCMQFSVFAPFFSFPRGVASEGSDYTDPDPFVFLPKSDVRPYEVAIFGVVDPTIGEHVGALNFSWLNVRDNPQVNKDVQTVVSAEDPAKALKQQLVYFDKLHPAFSGIRILLAQMSPQRARVLAASFDDRFPRFQIVVTTADEQQSTSEAELTTVWSHAVRASAFVAVPPPYFSVSDDHQTLEGKIHFGSIGAYQQRSDDKKNSKWTLQAIVKPPVDIEVPSVTAGRQFQEMITSAVARCLTTRGLLADTDKLGIVPPDKLLERVKWLTLCAMREELGADVALLQKRDLFKEFPPAGLNEPDNTKQIAEQALDRIVWKGDLLTLLYVPGSALKNALKQSDAYAREDSNPLSLADEKFRQLEFLGIEKSGNEYLIDEVPISDTKTYAVATSDYIGAGDTGYPDLAAAALNPKTRAIQFSDPLETISSVVCKGCLKVRKRLRNFASLHSLATSLSIDQVQRLHRGPNNLVSGIGSGRKNHSSGHPPPRIQRASIKQLSKRPSNIPSGCFL